MAAQLDGVLLGMGNPLLDISAEVENALLDKYELKLNNAILAEDKHRPLYAEMIEKYPVSYIAGGATQNSIRVAQWMIQKAHATSYIGCVGRDSYGDQLRKCATADNVAVHYLEDAAVPTGKCACLIHDKERSLVADIQAASHYKLEHLLTPEITAVWQKAQFFYIAGFFITSSPPSIMHIAKHAAEANKVFCMNLSAPFISQFFSEPLLQALPYVDVLFGNETEAVAFGEKQGYEEKTVEGIAARASQHEKVNQNRKRMVVITQGSKNVVVAQDGKVTEYPVPPISSDAIVDSNGAGDAFVGGFLSQLAQGKSTEQCVRAGNYAAGVILGVSGTVLPSTAPDTTKFA